MNREVLINIINRGGIRFIPVRRCFLCNEYVGYKFVRMCDGSMIQNWRSLYHYIVVIIMVLLCIRWKMVCIT